MKYRGIIFDFNGVLVWDIPWHREAWARLAARFGRKPFSDAEWQELEGVPTKDLLPKLLGETVPETELKIDEKEKDALYFDVAHEQASRMQLSPGAASLLNDLAARHVPRAIATSSNPEEMAYFVRELKLNRWFDEKHIIASDGTFPGKPAPDIYRIAAERIGVPVNECVVIEDSLSGIRAAKTAGAGLVIGLGSSKRHADLLEAGAGKTIETLAEIQVDERF